MSFHARKVRQFGTTKEVVSRIVHEAGGLKNCGFRLGKGLSQVAYYTDPQHASEISYDQVRRLTNAEVTAAAEDLAGLAGGHYVPGEPDERPLDVLASEAAREHGEYVATLIAKIDSNCQGDRACLLRELSEAIEGLVAVRTRLLKDQPLRVAPSATGR